MRMRGLYHACKTAFLVSSQMRLIHGLGTSKIRLNGGSVPVTRTQGVLKGSFLVKNATGAFSSMQTRCRTKTSCVNYKPFHFAAAGRGLDPVLKLRNCHSVMRRVGTRNVRLPVMTVNNVALRSVPTVVRANIANVTLDNAVLQTTGPIRRAGGVIGRLGVGGRR